MPRPRPSLFCSWTSIFLKDFKSRMWSDPPKGPSPPEVTTSGPSEAEPIATLMIAPWAGAVVVSSFSFVSRFQRWTMRVSGKTITSLSRLAANLALSPATGK